MDVSAALIETSPTRGSPAVVRWCDCRRESVRSVLGRYGLEVVDSPAGQPIPGSFWGDDEAGLIANALHARPDTPLHSVLHEGCHWICMDDARRASVHTDAGGDFDEENAVCYLQILLADRIEGYSAAQCMRDMDAWGYSFRLGSARAWFERDAEDARAGLVERGLLVDGRIAAVERRV